MAAARTDVQCNWARSAPYDPTGGRRTGVAGRHTGPGCGYRRSDAHGVSGLDPGTDGVTINDGLLDAIREFTGTILEPFDLDELLHRLTRQATAAVGAVGAGIMLTGEDGWLGFVAASEALVVEAERHQNLVREGACHEAHATNEIVVVDDLTSETRWPEYTPRVLGLGLRSVIGVPMNAHGQTIGVINIYREHAAAWSDEDIGAAQILASMGAGYILNANQLKAQHTMSEQLHAAIGSRDLIGQAKGIIMAQVQIDSDAAFEVLRQRSQADNRKLRDVAEDVVRQQSSGTASSRAVP